MTAVASNTNFIFFLITQKSNQPKHMKLDLLIRWAFVLILFSSYTLSAQFKISGTVTDEKGEPLTGATIHLLRASFILFITLWNFGSNVWLYFEGDLYIDSCYNI